MTTFAPDLALIGSSVRMDMAWAFSVHGSWTPKALTDFNSTKWLKWQGQWLMPAKCLLSYPCLWKIGWDMFFRILYLIFFSYFYIFINFLKCAKDILCTRKKVRLLGQWKPFCALLSDGINHWESCGFFPQVSYAPTGLCSGTVCGGTQH